MRDKQAFEAFVLQKSRARKQERQRRRRTILTTGMSLCICLLVVVCVTAVWKPWQDNGTTLRPGAPTPLGTTAVGVQPPMSTPTVPQMNSAPEPTGEDMRGGVVSTEKTLPQATRPPDFIQDPGLTTQEAPDLDIAFEMKCSDYGIPDKIEVLKGRETQSYRFDVEEPGGVDDVCRICDWIMQQAHATSTENGEGDVNGMATYTIRIYYREPMNKTLLCYLDSKHALFKMEDGPWLTVDAADVAVFKGFFDN